VAAAATAAAGNRLAAMVAQVSQQDWGYGNWDCFDVNH
jgi:hypothetical protein